MRVLLLVPLTTNQGIIHILKKLCILKKISNIPRIIQLDLNTGPFVTGFLKPIIVLPIQISNDEANFIIHHELEHLLHHHILIRACIEIISIIYWWNPIIWILRREIIYSLELQADANVMKSLSSSVSFSYLETLVKMSRQIDKNQINNLALPFSMKNSMIEYRIKTALKSNNFLNNRKSFIFYAGLLLLSIVALLFSFIYTFESYEVNPTEVEGTFSVNSKTDYLVLQKDKSYDLYINDKYVVNFSSIPEEFSGLSIY
ncbi:M56 family metallopeptidase [Clostridium sp. Marseille-P2415]|uniref:M56 family metallopeptidase n=1 Tax=Clostridium sp. Marseille-P2415 TaxID=1805471 RepID=UPI00228758BD|nr:M56 family metallopeptidase [Clostridium sp. Marseille-P2415]